MANLNHIQTQMLTKVAEATLDQTQGFAYVKNGATAAALAEAGLIELNPQMVEGDKIAARATNEGVDAYQNGDSVEPTNTNEGTETMNTENTAAAPAAFAIETGVPIPAIKRQGVATSIYPFDALEVGQSFFVPATDEMPNPGKSLASTVSSASKRYATEVGTRTINRRNKETGEMEPVEVPAYKYDRKFMVRTVEENGVKGARVWRIEPKDDEDGDDE